MKRPALARVFVTIAMSGMVWLAPLQSSSEGSPDHLVLTDHKPRTSYVVPQEMVRAAPPLVTITVERIDNPSQAQVDILVSLRWVPADQASHNTTTTTVGTLSLFPAHQPGTFTLRTSEAFKQLHETDVPLEALRVFLDFDLLPFDPQRKASAPLVVVIREPAWAMDEPQ